MNPAGRFTPQAGTPTDPPGSSRFAEHCKSACRSIRAVVQRSGDALRHRRADSLRHAPSVVATRVIPQLFARACLVDGFAKPKHRWRKQAPHNGPSDWVHNHVATGTKSDRQLGPAEKCCAESPRKRYRGAHPARGCNRQLLNSAQLPRTERRADCSAPRSGMKPRVGWGPRLRGEPTRGFIPRVAHEH